MAPEKKTQKRKAAVPDDEVAKVKKVKAMAAEVLPKKRKASSEKLEEVKKSKASKSSATDSPKSVLKKSSTKPIEKAVAEKPKSSKQVAKVAKELKALKEKKEEAVEEESDDDDDDLESDAEAEEEETTRDDPEAVEIVDDQTAALVAGFASDDEDIITGGPGEGETAIAMPELDKKTKKKMRKLQEAAAAKAASEEPGVIYLGRIPHGFYENEMKSYFKQFGDINHIRMSRNPKTGASKHYAFIEFESADVAEIVAKTMDNYLMFGHILKCKVVPKEQVHAELFKDSNRRFKKVPWNKIQGRALAAPKGEGAWEKKIGAEQKRREEKREKLKAAGIDYEFEAPAIKSAKGVAAIEPAADTLMIEAPEASEVSEATESPETTEVVKVVTETVVKKNGKVKKTTKTTKAVDGVPIMGMVSTEGSDPVISEAVVKKGGKSKKKRV